MFKEKLAVDEDRTHKKQQCLEEFQPTPTITLLDTGASIEEFANTMNLTVT
jgi:hypothetical protein